jgi:H+/Cl- antiporter ClcA
MTSSSSSQQSERFASDDLSRITEECVNWDVDDEETAALRHAAPSGSDDNAASGLRQRRRGGRRSSIVPTMDKIVIDTTNPARKQQLPSLDFDRVVNAFSIMAIRKRLTAYKDRHHEHHEMIQHAKKNGYDTFGDFDEQEKELLHSSKGKTIVRWFLTLLTGVLCASVAIVIVFFVSHIGEFRTVFLNWQLAVAAGHSDWEQVMEEHKFTGGMKFMSRYGYDQATKGNLYIFMQFSGFNAVLALTSAVLCIFFAPNAVGSGIPEVKAYLNGVCVDSFAEINVFFTKIVATILSVSSGLIVGPEGPLVHLGAIIGQGVTKTTRLEVKMRNLQLNRPVLAGVLGMSPLTESGEIRVKQDGDMSLRSFKDRMPTLDPRTSAKTTTKRSKPPKVDTAKSEDDGKRRSIFLSPEGVLTDSDDEEADTTDHGCWPKYTFLASFVEVLSRFRNDADRRDLISIGVAVGFASAFGAPVGGLLYSFEEASSYFSIPLMWRTLAATAVGTFVIAMYSGDISQYSILSLGNPIRDGEEHHLLHNRFAELPVYILIGTGGGLIGAFFNSCYIWTNTRRQKFYSNKSNAKAASFFKLVEVLVVSIITSLLTFFLPVYLPQSWTCTDNNVSGSETNTKVDGLAGGAEYQFNCPPGQFNEVASIMLGSRDDALNAILTDPTQFKPATLLTCGLAFILLMIVTFGVKLPSGLFMPSLLTGAMLGGWTGILMQEYVLESINPGHIALLGATALLAGIQRTTVSLCVIMMEATGQVKTLIPLIISVVVARYIADLFNEGFYHVSHCSMQKGYACRHWCMSSLSIAAHKYPRLHTDKHGIERIPILGAHHQRGI